jgi:hypothetical protein
MVSPCCLSVYPTLQHPLILFFYAFMLYHLFSVPSVSYQRKVGD